MGRTWNLKHPEYAKKKYQETKFEKSKKGKEQRLLFKETSEYKIAKETREKQQKINKEKKKLFKKEFYNNKKRDKQIIQLKNIYNKCWYCGKELNGEIHRDHIIARCRGGNNEIENLALTCANCNFGKYEFSIEEYLLWLAHIRSSSFECFILKNRPNIDISAVDKDKLQKSFI